MNASSVVLSGAFLDFETQQSRFFGVSRRVFQQISIAIVSGSFMMENAERLSELEIFFFKSGI
jgi:hypothetical protein